MISECSTEACLPYVKYMASENLLYDTGNPKLVLYDHLAGWDGEGGGKEVQEGGDICILTADPHCHMAETTTTL